jgi:hypothetical protein
MTYTQLRSATIADGRYRGFWADCRNDSDFSCAGTLAGFARGGSRCR